MLGIVSYLKRNKVKEGVYEATLLTRSIYGHAGFLLYSFNMHFLRKHSFLLALLLLVYAAYFFTHLPSYRAYRSVLGASANLVLFQEPQDGRQPLLSAIGKANREILVEVYLLSDKQILQALESANDRGVAVRVLLEEHPFGGGNVNVKSYRQLQTSRIPVKWTSNAFSLTHEKAMVIDGQEAFILNQNLTVSSFSKNREYDIEDLNPQDVNEIRRMFIADWERKSFTQTDENLVISPISSRDKLSALVQNATKSIVMETEVIEDRSLVELLANKARTVSVYIITPTLSQISSNKTALDTLRQAGAHIKMIASPYMHAKLILVDDSKAYIGSINLSTQSMDENRELGIIISQSDIVVKLSEDFAADWGSN